MGEAKRKAARRPAPASVGPDERPVDLLAIKIENPADFTAATQLIIEAGDAGLAIGDTSSIDAVKAYARPDGTLRICVVIGDLRQIVIQPGQWRELSAEEIVAKERERFARNPADPSSLQIPEGHIGLLVMMPRLPSTAGIFAVNDCYTQIAMIDRELDKSASANDDPRKDLAAFAEFRKQAFDTLTDAVRTKNEGKASVAMKMLLWAAMNTPGKAIQLKRGLSSAIADHGRAGIVMALIDHHNRVATHIAASLELPPDFEELVRTYEMSGVASTVFEAAQKPRKTN